MIADQAIKQRELGTELKSTVATLPSNRRVIPCNLATVAGNDFSDGSSLARLCSKISWFGDTYTGVCAVARELS